MSLNNIDKEIYMKFVANDVKILQQGKPRIYKSPVAEKRAKTMRNKFAYNAIVKDAWTLLPDPSQR